MKLKKIHITNFRSVEDSGEFEVDHIASLVGKNEAGKTAVLQAIAGLNPHPATPVTFEKERDYPKRYLARYDERHPDNDAVVITTTWDLADKDILDPVEAEFGPDAIADFADNEIKILRRYESDAPEWKLPIKVKAATQHLIANANFAAPEKSQIKNADNINSTQTLRQALQSIENPTDKHTALLNRLDSYPGKSISGKVRSILEDSLPQFMYFSNYDRMSGEVRLDYLRQRRDSGELFNNYDLQGERLFFEFLDYAGAPLDDILSATTYEAFNSRLRAASNTITDEIIEYWSQNPYIDVLVTVNEAKPEDEPPFDEGHIGRARINNQLHRVDMPFSERSAGFIWFFSFLIKFARVKKDNNKSIILLLDEPGLSLHGKAQADLLRYFEERLAPNHQLIYSTHSPFMVAPDKLTSARIVEDLVDTSTAGRPVPIGTKVRDDVLSTDPDSIFPLQGALGYEITQTLFVGKHTLLVEGPSDILYLKALSAALGRSGRAALDPHWVICPSGGIGNIRPFVSLFKGNDLNIVTFTDYAKGDKRKIESLRAAQILEKGAVLTADQFTGKEEADTEDLFDPELFVDLLNSAYELPSTHLLTADKLENADSATPRMIKKAEAYFRVLPESIPEFDHYRPAEWLIENPAFLNVEKESVIKTLDRAEPLIVAINGFLK